MSQSNWQQLAGQVRVEHLDLSAGDLYREANRKLALLKKKLEAELEDHPRRVQQLTGEIQILQDMVDAVETKR